MPHTVARGKGSVKYVSTQNWKPIDSVLVRRSYARGHLDVPKGGKSRKVELSTRLRTVLRTIYEGRFQRVAALEPETQARLEAEQAARAADALIFPGSDDGFLDEHNLRHRVWAPLLAAAKLRARRLHDLRHTFATLHLQSSTDPVWVSAQLGHHSVGFTLSTYAHLPLSDRGGHADRIEASAPKCTPNAPAADSIAPVEAEGDGLGKQSSVLPRAALA